MTTAIALLNLLNAATPGIADLITLIKKSDGTISVVVMLNGAAAGFSADIAQAQAWLVAQKPTA